MPISTLEPSALARLSSADLVAMALERDQAARRLAKLGRHDEALEADAESERLCVLYNKRDAY